MKNNTHLRFYCLLIFTYEKRCHFKNKGYKEILASSQKKAAGFSGHIKRKKGLDKLTLTKQIEDKKNRVRNSLDEFEQMSRTRLLN